MESNELPHRVKTLIDDIKEEQSFTTDKARRLLSNSDIQLDDLNAWADYDHPKADSYGRIARKGHSENDQCNLRFRFANAK